MAPTRPKEEVLSVLLYFLIWVSENYNFARLHTINFFLYPVSGRAVAMPIISNRSNNGDRYVRTTRNSCCYGNRE